MLGTVVFALTLNPSTRERGTLNLAPLPLRQDVAGELFCNILFCGIARTAESPLNPPTFRDFEFILPQSWGLGGLKKHFARVLRVVCPASS